MQVRLLLDFNFDTIDNVVYVYTSYKYHSELYDPDKGYVIEDQCTHEIPIEHFKESDVNWDSVEHYLFNRLPDILYVVE